MCGRFYVPEDDTVVMIKNIIEELKHRNVMAKTGEVFPGNTAAVLAYSRKLEPRAFAMEWGYSLGGKRIINARSETSGEKRLFADSMRCHRCLVPASHYFEWSHDGSKKTKYEIGTGRTGGILLAGLYRMEKAGPVFTILTRSPGNNIRFIHDRMPVIIPEWLAEDWMNPSGKPEEILQYADTDMVYNAC